MRVARNPLRVVPVSIFFGEARTYEQVKGTCFSKGLIPGDKDAMLSLVHHQLVDMALHGASDLINQKSRSCSSHRAFVEAVHAWNSNNVWRKRGMYQELLCALTRCHKQQCLLRKLPLSEEELRISGYIALHTLWRWWHQTHFE